MVEGYLNEIFDLVVQDMSERDRSQVRSYIDAREYGLALDDMADIVLKSERLATPALRNLFRAAARRMDMKPGTGWNGIDTLLEHRRAAS